MFSSGGWGEMILKITAIYKKMVLLKKKFLASEIFSLLNEMLVAKKDSADRASEDWGD